MTPLSSARGFRYVQIHNRTLPFTIFFFVVSFVFVSSLVYSLAISYLYYWLVVPIAFLYVLSASVVFVQLLHRNRYVRPFDLHYDMSPTPILSGAKTAIFCTLDKKRRLQPGDSVVLSNNITDRFRDRFRPRKIFGVIHVDDILSAPENVSRYYRELGYDSPQSASKYLSASKYSIRAQRKGRPIFIMKFTLLSGGSV